MLATWAERNKKRIPRKKDRGFDPNSEFVEKATKQYIRKGGKITLIIELPDDIENFDPEAADEFLCTSGHVISRNYPEGCFF